jgi:rubrerythrin
MTNSRFRNTCAAAGALVAIALGGCAIALPPAPLSNPADAHAPEAATGPLRPKLLTTTRTFFSSAADDREQTAKRHDMREMQHDMKAMNQMSKMQSSESYYTCSMHPQIHEPKPGQCPICGMTLIKESAAPEGARP